MLYQLSYTRVFGGAAISGATGQSVSSRLTVPNPTLTTICPAAHLPRGPAAMVGVGFEPT
jgi:hypothetical protein